jgi:hypothetical protein
LTCTFNENVFLRPLTGKLDLHIQWECFSPAINRCTWLVPSMRMFLTGQQQVYTTCTFNENVFHRPLTDVLDFYLQWKCFSPAINMLTWLVPSMRMFFTGQQQVYLTCTFNENVFHRPATCVLDLYLQWECFSQAITRCTWFVSSMRMFFSSHE